MHLDLLPFCPIFASIIIKSFILSTLGTLLYAKYSMAINESFITENRLKKYWQLTEKLTTNPWKTRIYPLCFFVNMSISHFCDWFIFFIEKKLHFKIPRIFFQIHFLFYNGFSSISLWASNFYKNGFQRWNSHYPRHNVFI